MTKNEVYPALRYFKNLLEKSTGGAYSIEIYGGGQLCSEVETTREVQDGVTIQMSFFFEATQQSPIL
jgi:TRAP-type C4-dicarboxylate transport system substrate-binding protein